MGKLIEFPTSKMQTVDLQQAFADWNGRRAYWAQHGWATKKGNYRLSADRRQIAPWNKLVKTTFESVDQFHDAAKKWASR